MAAKKNQKKIVIDPQAMNIVLDNLIAHPKKSRSLAEQIGASLVDKIVKANEVGHAADVISAELEKSNALAISPASVRKLIAETKKANSVDVANAVASPKIMQESAVSVPAISSQSAGRENNSSVASPGKASGQAKK